MLSLGGRKEKKRDLFICSGGRTEPVSARSHSSRKMSAIIFYRLTIPTRKRRPRFVISNSPLSSSTFAILHRFPCMSFSPSPVHSSVPPSLSLRPLFSTQVVEGTTYLICSGGQEGVGRPKLSDRLSSYFPAVVLVLNGDTVPDFYLHQSMRWLGVWAL